MSEELIQKNLTKTGIKIGNFEYFDTTRTNLNSFKKYKIIPYKDYGKYGKREPDGLLVERSNRNDIRVIIVREYKQPKEFRTDKQKKEAVQQCNDLCQVLDAVAGVITDGQTYIWINPKQDSLENSYIDRTTNVNRSYTYIKNEEKKFLNEPFILQSNSESDLSKLDEQTKNTLDYLTRILNSIGSENSSLKVTEEVDPLKLAQAVWQDIYINTAKSPIKCLYNVVELFIFKFLSDLSVLRTPYDFEFVYNMSVENSGKEALEYYAKNSRKEIKNKLFPPGKDGTTIINGTIFVNSDGKPVESQANLFKVSLKKYKDFGSLKNIKKEFKTKLFETFLKQSSDRNKLGQFFTPRKVVKTIVDMADVENLKDNSRVCDPFCGVGGFIAEMIQKPNRKKDFYPDKNGNISPKIIYLGYDKGTDEDDERIIILAKANMLIYLSDVIEKYPSKTTKFADVFNNIFHFLTESNLGTLKLEPKEDEKYDLILTNPPYITSGVTSIKDEIRNEGLEGNFTKGGKGVDGLALEWIIRNLKKGGKAFIILPSGIFNSTQNINLKTFLKNECYINGIISLPIKTFFSTPQKTFVLCITKKEDSTLQQDFPVFTYLVSDIGETLNIYRFETEGKSDLERAKDLFNMYKGAPKSFPVNEIGDLRCKLQPIEKFEPNEVWIIDKWWSKEEKINLGIEEQENIVTIDDYKDRLEDLLKKVNSYIKTVDEINEV